MDDRDLFNGITKKVNSIVRLSWIGMGVAFLLGLVARTLFDLLLK